MIHAADLLADLKKLVKTLQKSILDQLTTQPEAEQLLQRQHRQAVEQGRSGAHFQDWRDERITQAAVAWVLAATFVRFLEDNDLLEQVRLASKDPGGRGADESLRSFFSDKPHADERHFLRHVFETLAALPAAAPLFDQKHNPLWSLDLDPDGGAALLAFWRQRMSDHDQLRYDFTDPSWDTRFLGDLYQDLSEDIRKKYALLQTPDFVEEFILDYSLEPAIQRFGLKGLRMIDPTCGSGHFLLGAFQRLREHYERDHYQLDRLALVQLSLDAVHGVDLNPYAVAIARFRLTIAALRACDISTLAQAPAFKLHLATGDSLLHGKHFGEWAAFEQGLFEEYDPLAVYFFQGEDKEKLNIILGQQYHAVVGNPPYITVKDGVLRDAYRTRYQSAFREFSLGVPFTERFFDLALNSDKGLAGYVGMITANSFMKREFGRELIEKFFKKVHISHVIDTSGAYIPGHGTPTVILIGQNQRIDLNLRDQHPALAVLGIKGEPGTPRDPAKGLVWQSLTRCAANLGYQDEYSSSQHISRQVLEKHPWSLSGGGAAQLKEIIETEKQQLLNSVNEIGFVCMTRADDIYFCPKQVLRRHRIDDSYIIENVEGLFIRDWVINQPNTTLFPYDGNLNPVHGEEGKFLLRFLWPFRALLWLRREPNGNHREIGLTWYEWSRFQRKRFQAPLSISFAFVATHNHFVLDRGGKVFKQSAPVIKLPEGASEDDHLQLLGLLNSSTACFWMKQVFMDKGNGGIGGGIGDEMWERRFEFDGTKLKTFPVAATFPLKYAQILDGLANEISRVQPQHICQKLPTAEQFDLGLSQNERIFQTMVFWQEELDWQVYHIYGLIDEALVWTGEDAILTRPGERCFARRPRRSSGYEVISRSIAFDLGAIDPLEQRRRHQRGNDGHHHQHGEQRRFDDAAF